MLWISFPQTAKRTRSARSSPESRAAFQARAISSTIAIPLALSFASPRRRRPHERRRGRAREGSGPGRIVAMTVTGLACSTVVFSSQSTWTALPSARGSEAGCPPAWRWRSPWTSRGGRGGVARRWAMRRRRTCDRHRARAQGACPCGGCRGSDSREVRSPGRSPVSGDGCRSRLERIRGARRAGSDRNPGRRSGRAATSWSPRGTRSCVRGGDSSVVRSRRRSSRGAGRTSRRICAAHPGAQRDEDSHRVPRARLVDTLGDRALGLQVELRGPWFRRRRWGADRRPPGSALRR